MSSMDDQITIYSSERVLRARNEVNTTPEMCIERAALLTESYRQTESEPQVIRRAKSLAHLLRNMTIRIEDLELIVGGATKKRIAGPMLPEVQWEWYVDELDSLSQREHKRFQPLTEEEKRKARDMLGYWKGRSLFDKWYSVAPRDFQQLQGRTWLPGGTNPQGGTHLAHCCPGFERVLSEGVGGIKAQVASARSKLDMAKVEDFNASLFYQAVDISLDGLVAFATRYSNLASDLAAKESRPQRKAELEAIARNCARVPAEPPRTFWEALQAVWLTFIAVMLEGWGSGIGFGRMDQYLYPFYSRDLEAGKLTREEAVELIALFYVKLNEVIMPFRSEGLASGQGTGHLSLSVITLGGIDINGNNAVNDLSYVFLEAEEQVRLQEDLAVRIHTSSPDHFVVRACEVAKLVRGKIKFVSDVTAGQQLTYQGKKVQEARDYAVTGCFTRTVPGRSFDPGGEFLNLPLMLELAMNNGISRLGGDRIGPETGSLQSFRSFNDLWIAYTKQAETLIRDCVVQINLYRQLFAELLPSPLHSALYAACIEKGLDVTAGGTSPYFTQSFWVCGIPDVGDSLAAMKRLVFEDREVSLAQLGEALARNFEGDDQLLKLVRGVPKFGNDDDCADSMVNQVLTHIGTEVSRYTGFNGLAYTVAASGIQMNVHLGKAVGALPDGRRAGEPLTEGGISPHQGRNTSGPTATMRSVAKLDLTHASAGAVLNMRFNPESIRNETKMRTFAQMLKTFCETGGDLVQFNIVSTETLREAQQHPESYRDLLVRVATYSAYFVELPLEIQNDIIARTEFGEL